MQKILSQKPAASFLPFLVLLLVLAGTAAFRWHSRQEPLERDLAVFAYVGHQLLAGEKLYTQLWDIKPPGIFVFNLLAERVCGYGPAAVVALGIFFTLLSQAAVFLILRRLANPATGLLGAVFWGLASLSPRLQANLPSTEVLINGFTLLAVWGLVEYVHGRRAMLWLAGAAWALASWIKLNLFFPFLGTCVYLALPGTRPGPQTGWRAGASDYLPLLVPGAVLWAATFAYFLAAGSFRDFYEVVFTATRQYAGPLVANLWEFLTSARRLFAPALADVAVLGVLSLTWMAARLKAYRPLRRSFWLLLAAGEVLAIGTLDQPLPHYYQLLLPLFCLLPALLIHEVQENGGMRAGLPGYGRVAVRVDITRGTVPPQVRPGFPAGAGPGTLAESTDASRGSPLPKRHRSRHLFLQPAEKRRLPAVEFPTPLRFPGAEAQAHAADLSGGRRRPPGVFYFLRGPGRRGEQHFRPLAGQPVPFRPSVRPLSRFREPGSRLRPGTGPEEIMIAKPGALLLC